MATVSLEATAATDPNQDDKNAPNNDYSIKGACGVDDSDVIFVLPDEEAVD